MIRRRRRRTGQTRADRRSAADVYAAEVARRVQETRAGWVVIWSPWRRKFTAFGACTAERVIVDEISVERLCVLMDQAEGIAALAALPAIAVPGALRATAATAGTASRLR